jgi:hypothetical protein
MERTTSLPSALSLGETEPEKPGHRAPSRLSTFAWISKHRRTARDYEQPTSSCCLVQPQSFAR